MITLEEIRKIHKEVIEIDKDIDDYAPGELNSGILSIMLEYRMSDTYPFYYNAAVTLHTIAYRHPFNNGNKRTASATAIIILKNEGIRLTINEEEKIKFIIKVAAHGDKISIEMVEEWLRQNTTKISEIQV